MPSSGKLVEVQSMGVKKNVLIKSCTSNVTTVYLVRVTQTLGSMICRK